MNFISPLDDALRSAAVDLALQTPCLVIDGPALRRNIQRMAEAASGAGVRLRPHAKTHKCIEIAKLQLQAGAAGIACATVSEMESLAEGGVTGLLLTAPTAGADAADRLARLNESQPISVVCDHIRQVELLSNAQAGRSRSLQVLVDIDVGQARTGVTSTEDVVRLAGLIAARPGLTFAGIQGFGGHVQHKADLEARMEGAAAVRHMLAEAVAALATAGLPCPVVTGSGTGTAFFDMEGPFTELQVGSYLFMDADYAALEYTPANLPFETALFVAADVVSVNRPGQVTVNAGTKAFAFNGPPPHRILGTPAGSSYRFAGDEHGAIDLPAAQPAPELGTRLLISATHCDPTVNLHGSYTVIGEDGTAEIWPVTGRYR
ncbi:DSD1 family PLP-dependent enzyme [Allorhizobium pseudoryzae]|jgi:Predicted amino acid aldolase or racemase|uniref:DSD1 family PLP-dependent enzyme n=1 Tax=Allorhizobium pseudoryzae TaxID=379684 RepID=UPI003D07769F